MKWGRKKPSSPSATSRSFLISQVLPTSWLTKFKQTSINSGQKHANVKQKGKWNSDYTNSSLCANGAGKFCEGDGDAFWRLSFGEDNLYGMKSTNVLQSVRYNSNKDLEFPPSSYNSCRSNTSRVNGNGQAQKFSNVASQVRKMKGLQKEEEILLEQTCTREKVADFRTSRLKVARDKKLRKGTRRVFKEKPLELDGRPHEPERIPRNAVMKSKYVTEPRRTGGMVEREDCKLAAADSRKDCCVSSMSSRDSYGRKIDEDCVFAGENGSDGFSLEKFSFEWPKLKEKKIEALKSRSEEQRKSLHIRRDLQRKRQRQRVYSPRTASKVEICKIKALED
ncbi:transcription repressor OFP5-like [Hevea brasiliensis]|uniref:transcription repressor OFP5-like n=1 Tax=Hevea brasiliensis TaxID=3981 RepID=UPI0025FB2FE0|nr:transcription repressor OFP5-like [Hevea brasiliensis]